MEPRMDRKSFVMRCPISYFLPFIFAITSRSDVQWVVRKSTPGLETIGNIPSKPAQTVRETHKLTKAKLSFPFLLYFLTQKLQMKQREDMKKK